MWMRHLITLALVSAAKCTDLLRLRADTIDRWFNTSGAARPATWTVSAKTHVPHPWKGIGLRGHEANIRAKVDGVPVLIKARVSSTREPDRGGGAISEKATGAERDLLLTLIRHASKARDEDRPSFAQMVDHLDRFEKQKRGN